MTRRKRTAAAVGLCLATATTTPGLAFQLHAMRGISAAGRSGRGHDLGGRRPAACRHAVVRDDGHDDARRRSHALQGESTEEPTPLSPRGSDGRGGRAGGSKDVTALVLSALLLGNPQLSDAAAPTTAASAGAQGADTATQQNRLIADLENKLTSLHQPAQAPPMTQASKAPASASEQQQAGSTESRRTEGATASPQQSSATAGGAQQASQQAAAAPADVSAAAAGAYTVGALGTIGGEPIVKLQEYTFSVKLPELNLPRVGPITVPAEGGLFEAPGSAGKVEALPGLPGAEVVRDVLVRVQKGDDVDGLLRSISAMVPKQADYNRAVAELEQRVHGNVRSVENPLFAPGVPLATEFTSMLAQAKETAFAGVRSYLPKGVEPELALFMLVTLPVLTVALRSADENSRRPMPPPLPKGKPLHPPPRITRFPNSPAKVDAAAVAEARAARELLEAEQAVAVAAAEAEAAVAAAAAAAVPVVVPGAVGVVAAAAAGTNKLTTELERLQAELAAATKLAAKVEALETANARLMAQVADLSKQPAVLQQGNAGDKSKKDAETSRAALQKDLAMKQAASLRNVEEMTVKLTAAREIMSQSFPDRGGLALLEDEVAAPVEVSVVPAKARAAAAAPAKEKKPAARKKKAVAVPAKASAGKEKVAKKVPAAAKKVPAAAKKVPAAAKKEEEAVVVGGAATAAAVEGKKPVAEKKAKTTKVKAAAKKAPASVDEKNEEVRSNVGVAAAAAPTQNGSLAPGPGSPGGEAVSAVAAPPAARSGGPETPDDFDDLSEDLSRALRGVQGFDLDALDLEMDDLRPEDLEELRNLEREMGDLDMASLEAEFDQEDDETITHALRMAAESAMAHTSGGGRRIRTASPVGATSSRSPGTAGGFVGGGDGGGGGGPGDAERALRIGSNMYDSAGLGGGGEEGMGREFSSSRSAPPQAGAGGGLGDLEAFRKMEAEAGGEFGRWGAGGGGGGGEGGMEEVDDDWAVLSPAELKRKTVAQLKGYLDEEGVGYPGKVKKADLLDIVTSFLA